MTKDEFQHRYHDYCEQDGDKAKTEAAHVNAQCDGFTVEAVFFAEQGWALMLSTALQFIREHGIVPEQAPRSRT